ncbi:integrase core domain-containing protein [Acidisarcina polymorpha]
MAQEVGSRSLRSPNLTSCLPQPLPSKCFVWCYGPEFTSRRMLAWSEDWKIGLVHIQPGRPMQNGHVESFHGRLRDECLNASWFRTLNDVRNTLASWRQEYNWERPHSSLGYQTPEQFRQRAGYANVEGQPRLPHLHSHHGGYGVFPKPNLNRESPVMTG